MSLTLRVSISIKSLVRYEMDVVKTLHTGINDGEGNKYYKALNTKVIIYFKPILHVRIIWTKYL